MGAALRRPPGRLVSVALFLGFTDWRTSLLIRTAVSRHPALWSPDLPRGLRPAIAWLTLHRLFYPLNHFICAFDSETAPTPIDSTIIGFANPLARGCLPP